MIRISYDHAVFSWVYKNYKSFLVVETYDILVLTEKRICFERLIKGFYTLFENTFQEGPKLKPLNIIRGKYGITIGQIDHIMKNIVQ